MSSQDNRTPPLEGTALLKRIAIVTIGVCLVCSIVVSVTAVSLRDRQEQNKSEERRVKILQAAGEYQAGVPVSVQYEHVEELIVDLDTGEVLANAPVEFEDSVELTRQEEYSRALTPDEDIAVIRRRERFKRVFVYTSEDGTLESVIFPVRGYGLWSTMRGYLAIDAKLETVRGIEFFSHKETPGLGGEIDNPRWKDTWRGKTILEPSGTVILSVLKGRVEPTSPDAFKQIDGLAGATLTTKGVHNLVQFWLGSNGYGQFIRRLRARDHIDDLRDQS